MDNRIIIPLSTMMRRVANVNHIAMVRIVLRDPAPDNVIYVDRVLCAASESYRASREREKALARFADAELARRKEYFTAELGALRKLPEAQRTSVPFEQAWSPLGTTAIIAVALAAALAVAVALLACMAVAAVAYGIMWRRRRAR